MALQWSHRVSPPFTFARLAKTLRELLLTRISRDETNHRVIATLVPGIEDLPAGIHKGIRSDKESRAFVRIALPAKVRRPLLDWNNGDVGNQQVCEVFNKQLSVE